MPAHRAVHEWIIADKDGGSVADCSPAGPWMALTEADANARLIAAAPELLSALKAIIEAWQRGAGGMYNPIAYAREIVAKAGAA
jgi:hypothetical protein